MAKRKKEISKEKKHFTTRQLTIISLLLTAIIISTLLLFYFFLWTGTVNFPFKAIIVDQLGGVFESQNFVGNVTQILQQCNFTVTPIKSVNVTVNFYKNLPKYNPGIIIFRVHAAIRENTTLVDFFTSERYLSGMYEEYEYSGALSRAWLRWEPNKEYFAIGPTFVGFMDGAFPKSVVIAMGCSSLNKTTMAQAFIDKGAKLYIGWTEGVSIEDSDYATINLLSLLFLQNKTIMDAINQCNRLPFYYPGRLDYFPKGEAIDNKKIWDLVLESSPHRSGLLKFEGVTFLMSVPFKVEKASIKRTRLPFRNVWLQRCKVAT